MFGLVKKDGDQADIEVFVLFDSKVGVYRDPVLSINRFDMVRNIELFFRNPQNASDPLVVNAEDFQLFKVGEYTRKTGVLRSHGPEHVANLHEIKSTVGRQMAQEGPVGIAST